MTDVIKTFPLSASVANDKTIFDMVARKAHPKRVYRVQVRLCNGTAVNHQVLKQKIALLLAEKKNFTCKVSVRPFEASSAQDDQGMHELTLFEHPPIWHGWLTQLGIGKNPDSTDADTNIHKPDTPPPPQPTHTAKPHVVPVPRYNPKLHEAFRQAIAPYPLSELGDWMVERIVFNYRDPLAHSTLAPMIGEMPPAELLAYLSGEAGRTNLVPADRITVTQLMHGPVGEGTVLVAQGDLWVEVMAQQAYLMNAPAGEETTLPSEDLLLPTKPATPPSIRFILDSQTTTQDDLVHRINQRVKTNAQLTRVELRLSRWGTPPLDEQMARAAVINLLRERGLVMVQASVKPFAHALQHADGQHTLTLFEASRPKPWWQRLVAWLNGSTEHAKPTTTGSVNSSRQTKTMLTVRREPGFNDPQQP